MFARFNRARRQRFVPRKKNNQSYKNVSDSEKAHTKNKADSRQILNFSGCHAKPNPAAFGDAPETLPEPTPTCNRDGERPQHLPLNMDPSVTTSFRSLPAPSFPGEHAKSVTAHGQQEAYFHMALHQSRRAAQLQAYFEKRSVQRLFVGANINGFEFQSQGWEVTTVETDFFLGANGNSAATRREVLDGAIVLLNNNDVARLGHGPVWSDFQAIHDKTLFILWDWDNHHWLEHSVFCATHSDLYVPAQHENLYLLSRYNWAIAGPVYAASVQWSRRFLTEHTGYLLGIQRSDAPLGRHVLYPAYPFRNSVVNTLSSHYPSIGFSLQNFHVRTPEDRLQEWSSHKLHWIMPVLNDIAIRIFDALITGGIPIVPASLQSLAPVNTFPREHVVFFPPEAILHPEDLVNAALARFDQGGLDQLLARHRFALEHHHGSSRITEILRYAQDRFGFVQPAARTAQAPPNTGA